MMCLKGIEVAVSFINSIQNYLVTKQGPLSGLTCFWV